MPRASIVMTSYEQAYLVSQAIRRLAMSSFSSELEVIIVDDGSKQPLRPILVSLQLDRARFERVRMVRIRENAGVSAARNLGMSLVTAPYVNIHDGDDFWLDGWEAAVKLLDESGAVAVGTGICHWYSAHEPDNGDTFSVEMGHRELGFPLTVFPPANQCLLVRREEAPTFRIAPTRPCVLWFEPPGLEDVSWWIEVCASGPVVWSGHRRVYRIVHETAKWYTTGFRGVAAFVVSRPDLFEHAFVSKAIAHFEGDGIDVELVKAIMNAPDEPQDYDVLFDSADD